MLNALAVAIALGTIAAQTAAIAADGDFDRALRVQRLSAKLAQLSKAGPSQLDAILDEVRAAGINAVPGTRQSVPPLSVGKTALKMDLLELSSTDAWAAPLYSVIDQIAAALPANPSALVILAGSATLKDIAERMHPSMIEVGATEFHSNVPIIIAPGATLALAAGDTLTLDTAAGSFLLNEGTLISNGGTILGDHTANTGMGDYHPFVLTVSPGSARVVRTSFSDLGIVGVSPLTGVGFLNQHADLPSSIEHSWFSNVASLSAQGSDGFSIETSLFDSSAGPAIFIESGYATGIVGNVVLNPVSAEGIRVTASGNGTVIGGNVVLGAAADGINIDHGVGTLEVTGNLIAQSVNSGLSIDGASCVHVAANWLVSNGDNGMAIRDSLAVDVDHNIMASNGAAGLLIGDEPLLGQIAFRRNDLANNKVGISARSPNGLRLSNNDLADQTRLFGNALRELTTAYLNGGSESAQDLLSVASNLDLASNGNAQGQICAPGEGT